MRGDIGDSETELRTGQVVPVVRKGIKLRISVSFDQFQTNSELGDVLPRSSIYNYLCIGERGPKGYKGEMGEKGFRGNIGFAGQKGERGLKGYKGEEGNVGDRGKVGREGEPGKN